jgi:hypothetical protein
MLKVSAMPTAPGDQQVPRLQEVFISYSRKDKEFVRRLHEALSWRDREAWVDWEDIQVALAALEGSGYLKLESEDREAKTKKFVWSVCVDPEGITALDGLSARKMSAATWFSVPKSRQGAWFGRQANKHPEGSKTSTQRM